MKSDILLKTYEMLNAILPILCVMGIFYVMVVIPQRKKMVQQKTLLEALKKGDKVITDSGIFGVIHKVADQEVHLMIADGVIIALQKSHIAGMQKTETA